MNDRTTGLPSTLTRVRGALERRLGVDPRALAAFRISVAVVLLLDLGLRARDLTAFYSDAGVLPRATLVRLYPAYSSVSVHMSSGEAWAQAVLFLVAAGFATALLAGYRTRIAALASLALLVSLHARNPMVLNAGDVLLRRLLFWGVFLPLGAHWAFDSRSAERDCDRIAGVASAALLVQVVLVYFANVAFKLRTDVWLRGDAIQYIFELDEFTVGLAPIAVQYPVLLEFGAHGWFVLLCSSPLLLVFTGRLRTALVSLFAAGHLGMLATMDLGIFPLVSLAALLPFLPPSAWDRMERYARPALSSSGPIRPALNRYGDALPSVPRWNSRPRFGGRTRTARSVLVAGLLATMLLLNVFAVGLVHPPETVPEAAEDRSWNMFGNPPKSDGWYVAHGTLESGREVTGHVSASRWGGPPAGGDRYPRSRWRKFQSNLGGSDKDRLRAALASDLCRRWSGSSDDALRSITIERVRERTNLTGPDQRESTVVGQYDC